MGSPPPPISTTVGAALSAPRHAGAHPASTATAHRRPTPTPPSTTQVGVDRDGAGKRNRAFNRAVDDRHTASISAMLNDIERDGNRAHGRNCACARERMTLRQRRVIRGEGGHKGRPYGWLHGRRGWFMPPSGIVRAWVDATAPAVGKPTTWLDPRRRRPTGPAVKSARNSPR